MFSKHLLTEWAYFESKELNRRLFADLLKSTKQQILTIKTDACRWCAWKLMVQSANLTEKHFILKYAEIVRNVGPL
jgi:hypothetical protein